MRKFVDNMSTEDFLKTTEARTFPLQFDTIKQQVDFFSLLSLLSFGSGYNEDLLEASGRDSKECVLFGVFGLQITKNNLSASTFSDVSLSELASDFNFPISQEKPTLNPIVTEIVETPLRAYALLLVNQDATHFEFF